MSVLGAVILLPDEDTSAQWYSPWWGWDPAMPPLGSAVKYDGNFWGAGLNMLAVSCFCTCYSLHLRDLDSVLICPETVPLLIRRLDRAELRAASHLGCFIQTLGDLVDDDSGEISCSHFGHYFGNIILGTTDWPSTQMMVASSKPNVVTAGTAYWCPSSTCHCSEYFLIPYPL